MNREALDTQQQALLQALLARPGSTQAHEAAVQLSAILDMRHPQAARGWAAYQANGHAMAERALRSAYPVVSALMGADNFALLACDLWHQHPPVRGDLAQWGAALPDFLQRSASLVDVPYLSDVAHTEWALHRAAGAADAVPDPASFARLAQESPEGLTLTLAPGTAVVCSPYPVVSLVNAHLDVTPRLDEAAHRLRTGEGEYALVWRQGHHVRLRSMQAPVCALLQALLAGADLPQALDAAGAVPDASRVFDFTDWLGAAVADALVVGVHSLNTPQLCPLRGTWIP